MEKIWIKIFAISLIAILVVGCSTKQPDSGTVTLTSIHEAVKKELGENYIPSRDMDKAELENIVGIDMDDVAEFIAQAPMISMHVDTFIAIKSKPGESSDVTEDLVEYREELIQNSIQYPMNMAKVSASEVITEGDYVFFVMLGAFDERMDVSEADQLKFAQDEVAKVKKTILGFFK